MALLEDMFKGNAMTGLAVGLAAVVLGPSLVPTIGRVLRPAAKTVIKGGIVMYRETLAEISELTTGLIEEAQNEIEHDRREQAAAAESANGKSSTVHHDGPREKR